MAPQLKVLPQLLACATTAHTGKLLQPFGVAMHTSPSTQSADVLQAYCESGRVPKPTERQLWSYTKAVSLDAAIAEQKMSVAFTIADPLIFPLQGSAIVLKFVQLPARIAWLVHVHAPVDL